MPFLLILGAAGAAWYFGVWPFDGRTWKPKDTAYMAEVAYYVGSGGAVRNAGRAGQVSPRLKPVLAH